ncbi:MAG: hypothetical protein Q9168_003913 [Polycauliona sp. 1 TL-2023]
MLQDQSQPDITIWSDDQMTPLVVGEAKTPWTLALRRIMDDEPHMGTNFVSGLPRVTGQVAGYMKSKKHKYGFLTTYAETVFFKQELLTFDGTLAVNNNVAQGTRKNVLYYSNCIHHETNSAEYPQDHPGRRTYRDMVSLRECMLYLMRLARADDSQNYPDYGGPWINTGKTPRVTFVNFGPGGPTGQKDISSSSSQPSSSKGKEGLRPRQRATDPLADRMSALSIDQREKKELLRLPEVKVRYDDSQGRYKFSMQGHKGYVSQDKIRCGMLVVEIHGKEYRVIKA